MNNAISKLKDIKEIENLSVIERDKYYKQLKEHCMHIQCRPFNSISQRVVYMVGLLMRQYDFEIRGIENIPEEAVVFVCNHSNSRDFFTLTEVFTRLKRKVTPLAAVDGLNWLSRLVFNMVNTTFISREDSESKKKGKITLCNCILNGISTIIFAESTWNLHPINTMLPIKAGPVDISLVTSKKIIPTIFEYVEVNHICKKESQLYSKVIVCFGKVIETNTEESLFKQTEFVQNKMEEMRHTLWKELGIKRGNLNEINVDVYMNHLNLKKNKAVGFKYITEHESRFIRRINGLYENEYYIDVNGCFAPRLINNKDM